MINKGTPLTLETVDVVRQAKFQIYVMYDLDDDAWYVGSAWNRTRHERFSDHMQGSTRSGARLVKERVALGHRFEQFLLEAGFGTLEEALECEEKWIRSLIVIDPERTRLNVSIQPTRGVRGTITPEERVRRSERLKGKPRPGGTPWLIGHAPASKGKKMPSISVSKMGKARSPEMRAIVLESTNRKYICLDCPLVSTAAGLQHHIDATGHSGKRVAEENEIPPKEEAKAYSAPRMLYECNDCGHVTLSVGLAAHQRASGHQGRREVGLTTHSLNHPPTSLPSYMGWNKR